MQRGDAARHWVPLPLSHWSRRGEALRRQTGPWGPMRDMVMDLPSTVRQMVRNESERLREECAASTPGRKIGGV